MAEEQGRPRINVVVVATSPDVKAAGIAAGVTARPDMHLVERGVVPVARAEVLVRTLPPDPPCAFVVVGPPWETDELARKWLEAGADLVVLRVEVAKDIVLFALRNPGMDTLLTALRELVERAAGRPEERAARIQLRSIGAPRAAPGDAGARPLLVAAVVWVHALLRDAVARLPVESDREQNIFAMTKELLLRALDTPDERDPDTLPKELVDADVALERARTATDPASEPLAAAGHALELSPLEFRMLLLGLAPELDPRFQRCIGFLLDEMARRVGTTGLYGALLGVPAHVRGELAHAGALSRWHVFETSGGRQPAADEPFRLDPPLVHWLLGDDTGLIDDARIRRVLRDSPWSGSQLLQQPQEAATAVELVRKLRGHDASRWLVLAGNDPAGWRALLELGAKAEGMKPTRVAIKSLAGIDVLEIEYCARRVGRAARLMQSALVVDVTGVEGTESEEDATRVFLAAVADTKWPVALLCRDATRVVRLLGATSYELAHEPPVSPAARVAAVQAAADGADAYLSEESAAAIAHQYPLDVERLEHAMHLAASRPLDHDRDNPRLARFTAALKEVAAEGISHLAERVEPIFDLDEVVLPADRKAQLIEIVDNVRLAPRVLDEWKFRAQLPYGRGVTALFFGPSGTGKTMAALGIARRLGIQMLRLDLSRVVSKYIGDTEKNIDRVFRDAEHSGAAILIDEADALFGKRSEVKDAHDRYANIEVAYLLQRMEAYEGLAILTTNLRQNLDPAFLRRLRFIVEFPRPDVDARERIWRQCLTAESHALDDADFRQLARKIDVTGGHIRQITLRAAFIAAAAGTKVRLEDVAHAAQAELAKLGMPPPVLDPGVRREAA